MRSFCTIAMAGLILATTYLQQRATAGVVADKGDAFWWVSNLATGAPNNDDFVGQFADNPNKLNVNSVQTDVNRRRQRVTEIERIVPATTSGGVTEYALTLGGSSPEITPGSNFPLELDNRFIVELGFGTGNNFVPARQVASQLRFDSPDMVSPAIPNYKPIPILTLPVLELLQDRGDSLLIQGRYDCGNFRISSFSDASMLVMPLDIPDLPLSARAYYSDAELAGLGGSDVPFTIRMHVIPEPAGIALATLALAGTVLIAGRTRRKRLV